MKSLAGVSPSENPYKILYVYVNVRLGVSWISRLRVPSSQHKNAPPPLRTE